MCSSSSLTTPPSTPWKGWTHAWPSSTLPTSAPPCPAPSRSTRSAWPPMRADGTAARWSLSTRRLSSATSSTSTTAAITLFPSTTLGRFAQTSSLCLSRCKRNHFYIQCVELNLSSQAIECYLANISPKDDENVSAFVLEELIAHQIVQARMIGTNESGVPMIHLYRASNGQTTMVNKELVDRSCANWIETTIVQLDPSEVATS